MDLPLPTVFLARERQDLIKKFITVESNYYSRHTDKTPDTWREGPLNQQTVCDVYGSFSFIPVRPGGASEILSRQVFEHLSMQHAEDALKECRRALGAEGLLRLDIPDPDETLRQYRNTGDEFYIRHLFGPRRNEYGFHTHYTRKMLIALAERNQFKFVEEEKNPHSYPAYTLRFIRE